MNNVTKSYYSVAVPLFKTYSVIFRKTALCDPISLKCHPSLFSVDVVKQVCPMSFPRHMSLLERSWRSLRDVDELHLCMRYRFRISPLQGRRARDRRHLSSMSGEDSRAYIFTGKCHYQCFAQGPAF